MSSPRPMVPPYVSIRTVFEAACERAKLKDVTPHTRSGQTPEA